MSPWSNDYPNVRARLVRHRHLPGIPDLVVPLSIWLSGRHFRVRDESRRPFGESLEDLAGPTGLGRRPHTIEDIMDLRHADAPEPLPPADYYGDHTAGRGLLFEAGRAGRSVRASLIAPLAEQILSTAPEHQGAEAAGTRLGRPVRRHRWLLEGQDAGHVFRSEFQDLVDFPFVLERTIRNADVPDDYAGDVAYVRMQVLELSQGVVTEADLTPPSAV